MRKVVIWGVAIALVVGTCATLQEMGWTGIAWIIGAWYLGKFIDNQERIRAELEEMNARQRGDWPPY